MSYMTKPCLCGSQASGAAGAGTASTATVPQRHRPGAMDHLISSSP